MPRELVGAPERWHGVVLAGGAARRFGRDKVFASVGGRRLIDAALASLARSDGRSVLLGTRERSDAVSDQLPHGVDALPDDHPGHGPMGGLATALARHPDGWTAVLAADLPLVPAGWWPWLAGQHVDGAVAIVPRDERGRWEPLAALYHGSLGAALGSAVASGDPARLGFQPWLDALAADERIAAVDPSAMGPSALLNVNRPEDAAEVERLLATAG